ncbi:dTMP kinase [Deferribacter autotrophicus]|uniref:Thymidylate kinase n=1 Tax=Deferribacter autotrophicus TaxID=500465 RepID=A0A5A8F2P5_9BACT|nr:dTMP kinase [Deferribacter autotrophicus]KAA0257677.1 dTMP kinase [Deferribacter autotrophicus]
MQEADLKKGLFFVIDGIDGCGKTTQSQLVVSYLKSLGKKVILTKEPGGTEVGKVLRNILLSTEFDVTSETELLLYSADRLEHQKKVIEPNILDGNIIVCDRFISSTYAYQIFGRGLNINILKTLEKISVKWWPDITFIIDIKPEVALNRALERLKVAGKMEKEGKFEQSGLEFYKKVREGFLWYSKSFKNVIVIDGSKSIDDIFENIKQEIEAKL